MAGLVDLAIASTILLGLMVDYGVPITPSLAVLPLLVAVLVVANSPWARAWLH